MDGEDALKRIRLHFPVLTIPMACAYDLVYILGQRCKTNFITDHYGSNQTDVWCVRHLKSQQGQSFTSSHNDSIEHEKDTVNCIRGRASRQHFQTDFKIMMIEEDKSWMKF